jgi:hypothetical protein
MVIPSLFPRSFTIYISLIIITLILTKTSLQNLEDDLKEINFPNYDVRENFRQCYNSGYDQSASEV